MTRTLHPDWQAWIARALLDGHPPDAVAARLAAQGVDDARRRVDEVAASPILAAAREALAAALVGARTERLACALRRRLLRQSPGGVERRRDLDAAAFFATYVAHNVPVHLPGFAADWPAMTTWQPDALAARWGEVEVTACLGRDADAAPDLHFRRHQRAMSLAAWIAWCRTHRGNDGYMIANDRNLDGPLAALVDDLAPPPGFVDRFRLVGGASLWIGPAGTHTPTHHDTTNVLFCQLVGRKVVWLASPDTLALAADQRGFYSACDLSDRGGRDRLDARVLEVELAPGDALLLPVGWWHEVRALDLSVSCSITALKTPNRFDEHTPGFPPNARAAGGPHGRGAGG